MSALTSVTALDGPEVYSPHELARAAGVPVTYVRALVDEGRIATLDGELIAHPEALRVGRALKAKAPILRPESLVATFTGSSLFATRQPVRRSAGLPAAVSSAVHGFAALFVIFLAMPGVGGEPISIIPLRPEPARLVYLVQPGPGGGGGGGGRLEPKPAPRAERKGDSLVSSPMPEPEPPPPVEPEPPPPEPPPPMELETLNAPIVVAPAESEDRPGLLEPSPSDEAARGAGEEDGAGAGTGRGRGDGQGSGVGEGVGGGAGGGPYGPGSGVEPPVLVREVKPDYTEDARRRNVIGEVLLEVVVRRDGSVGSARVLRALGFGLDEQAVQAVKQWRFTPGTLKGVAVDVLVEIAVDFQLR